MDNGFILIKRYDYIRCTAVHGVEKDDIVFLKTLDEVREYIVNDIKEFISYLENKRCYNPFSEKEFDFEEEKHNEYVKKLDKNYIDNLIDFLLNMEEFDYLENSSDNYLLKKV